MLQGLPHVRDPIAPLSTAYGVLQQRSELLPLIQPCRRTVCSPAVLYQASGVAALDLAIAWAGLLLKRLNRSGLCGRNCTAFEPG